MYMIVHTPQTHRQTDRHTHAYTVGSTFPKNLSSEKSEAAFGIKQPDKLPKEGCLKHVHILHTE